MKLTKRATRMLEELGEIVVEGRLITREQDRLVVPERNELKDREQNRLKPKGSTRKPTAIADASADKEKTDEPQL